MTDKILEVRGLTKTYGGEKRKGAKQPTPTLDVLKGIDIDIYRGDVVCLIGPSGCGKSTFLRCLNRLEIPTGGSIKFEGIEVDDAHIDAVRQKMGMVFQHFNLFPHMTVKKNITLAPVKLGLKSQAEADAQAMALLERIGLADKANEYPAMLSGGQKQRIAIVRALAMAPEVMLFDEPTSALDPQTTKAILHLLKHLNETLGITIVLITHEMAVVKEICSRVAVMEYGRVVEQGEVFTVFAEPKQDITKSFIHTTSNLQKVEELIAEDSPVTRLQPGELIVRLSYIQRNVNEPIISAVSQMFNVSLNIIFADITIVQDSPIGGTVAIISGERKQITKAIEYLIEKNVGVEVIKDARADR